MAKLKYRLIPEGAAQGMVPINLVFIDKKDIDECGILMVEACRIIAKELNEPAAIDVMDMDAITVTSDGILADGAVVAFASADYGVVNREFGFLGVSEMPYSRKLLDEEPHMKQWDANYRGKRLYRGSYGDDMRPRDPLNERQTITGRIANNNTGSEMMNVVDMTEILTPMYGILAVMRDGEVLIGHSGPVISVGIGMVVRERAGRIFGWGYGAGQTAHASGDYAKTIKSDCWALCGTKEDLAEYTIRALEIGMIPGRHIACSPANLCLAHAMGLPIDLDGIFANAWEELESIGITRADLEKPCDKPMSREEAIAHAAEIIPGIEDGKRFKVSDICQIRYAEC